MNEEAKAAKTRRLAEALRANLRRRKTAARSPLPDHMAPEARLAAGEGATAPADEKG